MISFLNKYYPPVFCMLLLLCCILTGCAQEEDPYTKAVGFFKAGDYSAAEPYFITAIETGDNRMQVRLGHAYNLLQLEEYPDAISELIETERLISDNETLAAVKETMLDAYLTEENYAGAARVCEELSKIVKDEKKQTEYLIQAATIRSDLYLARGDISQYEDELRKLIELKDYAADEYVELYRLACGDDNYTKRLKVADDFTMYVTGRTAYVEDFTPFLSILFDASNVAKYADYEHDREYYFSKIEEFMTLAEDRGAGEEQLLKLKIVLAEHRGKMELAYKLLGVYLNHCPEDALAVKEKEYLENRIGLE